MKKSYLFLALGEGVVAMRTFACWCHACMLVIGRGEGGLDSSLHCAACCSPHLPWQERSCGRSDANGVANARAKSQGQARKLAVQLQGRLPSGRVLVGVQNRGEDDQDQYWLGWATRVVKTYTEAGTIVPSQGAACGTTPATWRSRLSRGWSAT